MDRLRDRQQKIESRQRVDFDAIVMALARIGKDMISNYKEIRAGLALAVTLC